MRIILMFLMAIALHSVSRAQPADDRVQNQFRSDNYTVTWGTAAVYEADSELEIGKGNGHGGTLSWLRFQPMKDGVDVLSIQFDEDRTPYNSKWPPDRATVTVKSAWLKNDAYTALLRDLGVVDSAKLKPVERTGSTSTSNSFWVYARLTTSKKTLIDYNWAGYEGSDGELDFAKPRAAIFISWETIKGLNFKDHILTDTERAWASGKFIRDWKKFEALQYHWWVRERYIETIGVIGDKAALPVLRDTLATVPPKGKPRDAAEGRCVYLSINAATRLLKRDVRDNPVEEMDIEKTRHKILDLIKDAK